MLVVDDNTGSTTIWFIPAVANPNHCIEEWIDDRVYLTQKLIDTGDIEFDQCMTYWSTKIGHDASLACGRLVLGYQRLWPKKVRIYKKAHSWIRDSALTSNFWCESDFLLRDWQEKSIERDLWMSPNDSEDPATCELKGTAWKWLPNKQINHTII
ncbi:hypothetical protein OSTOST_22305, partial [Ostertagia ostertagi]